MKTPIVSLLVAGLCAPAGIALAGPHAAPRPAHAPPAHVAAPRATGVHSVSHYGQAPHPQHNPPHEIIVHNTVTNRDEHHQVVVEHRPAHVVARDPHLRVIARGYHPAHNWSYWHRPRGAYFQLWGITSWADVGTVTCEAVNETTGALYPVSQDRDATGWDDDQVNSVLDAALDDCFAEAGGAQCSPVTPACSFQDY